MNIEQTLIDEIRLTGGIWLTVNGNSMKPTILDKQKVFIVSAEKYSIGDIIAFNIAPGEEKSHFIVHRVIFVRKNYLLTKGDNNLHIDPIKVRYENIIGIVEKIC